MKQYKYISDIDQNTFESNVVVPCINDEGYRTILIKNKTQNRFASSYATKHLIIKKNIVLVHGDLEFYCHIITCKNSDPYTNRNFDIINEYLFQKLDKPIDEFEFSELLNSIEQLFDKANGEISKHQIGIAGELITLLYFAKQGFSNVLNNYHKNFFSHHDIEISDVIKIEVKTSAEGKRIHKFNHEQLNDKHMRIYISSVKLYTVEKGMSLYQLFDTILKIVKNYETKFLIYKLMNFCCVDEINQGITFSLEDSLDSVRIFHSKDIPQIKEEIPKGVLNISYSSDCELVPEIDIKDIVEL
ncbi:PD-(D/E)XK motif protein [Acholeplasma equifetale]|uniref:PD-(D/E)XK motif protein n=1 Tax=Acholeplasma equifetale TaxID=264634 RepID=UPI00047E9343|nr:PD-(D/E)XK motif protein [Acholeplasma equifetale]